MESELADREVFCSSGLAREADVGDAARFSNFTRIERDRVAVAIAAGGGIFQVRFERGERSGVPMPGTI